MNYRQNAIPATFELKNFKNPSYVITSDSFYLEINDKDGNKIVETTGGMVYTTTPGTMKVGDWYASNRLVSAFSELTFSVQPLDPTVSSNVQVKLSLPSEDFEVLPDDPCDVSYHNQLIRDGPKLCKTDVDTNTIILQDLLKDPYQFEEFELIEFSVDDIKMPSSSRPTGEYKIEFYDNIDGIYRLVDVVTVSDKFRAIPGGLYSVNVIPQIGMTYNTDLMTVEFILGHKILQGGYFMMKLPPQLTFVDEPECLRFSEFIDQDAKCVIDKE